MSMKRNRGTISLLISLGIHIILMIIISPFIMRQFKIFGDDHLSLTIFRVGDSEQVKRRVIRQHKLAKLKRNTDDGSPVISPAALKYVPEMNPPKAPVYDNVAPEIVTYTDLPQTDANAPPNVSFGKDVEAAGPVVMLNRRGAGGTARGPGRGGSGTGPGSSMHKGLPDITGLDNLASLDLDENIMGLGIFDTDVQPGHGLIGQVFIPGKPIIRIPNFERLTPVYTFATAKLDVTARDYTEGFPTSQKQTVYENFAIRFRAKLAVDTPGQYFFELYSDDGSKLFINGQLIVDNDGVHQPISSFGYLDLKAGFHPVEIHYFQGPRYKIALRWFYKPPNGSRRVVPPEVIFHPGEHDEQNELRKLKKLIKRK